MNARKNNWLLTGVQMALLVWSSNSFAADKAKTLIKITTKSISIVVKP